MPLQTANYNIYASSQYLIEKHKKRASSRYITFVYHKDFGIWQSLLGFDEKKDSLLGAYKNQYQQQPVIWSIFPYISHDNLLRFPHVIQWRQWAPEKDG